MLEARVDRRRMGALAGLAGLGLLAGCADEGGGGPPPAARVEVEETFHGHSLTDPYAWMEETGSERVREWVLAQDARTRADLESALEASRAMRARAESYDAEPNPNTPERRGDTFFLMVDGTSHSGPALFTRESGTERVLVAPERFLDDGLSGAQIADFRASPDGAHVVVVAEEPASRRRLARVVRVADGAFLPERLPGVELGHRPWRGDGSGFVYATRRGEERPAGVWLHELGMDAARDRRLHAAAPEMEARYRVHVADDRDDLLVVETAVSGERRAYRLSAADGWSSPATVMSLPPRSRLDALGTTPDGASLFYAVTPGGGEAIVASRPAGGGRFSEERILDVSDLGVSTAHLYGGRLVLNSLDDGVPVIRVHDLEGRPLRTLEPPFGLMWTNFPAGRPAVFGEAGDRYAYLNSIAMDAPGIYEIDLEALTLTPWLLRPGTEEVDAVVRRISYVSSDGVEVPMALAHRRDAAMDGESPALVWVYGAHGFVATPYFNSFFRAFIDAGGVFAMPQVRGGGVHGARWHEAGSRANKLNTVADTIAALEWLVEHDVTRPEKLAVLGNSAGTVPVAAAAIRRPDLVGAVILEVPLSDLVRHPRWSEGWNTEFGDPEVPEELEALLQFSPYELLKRRRPLPPTLILAGEEDPVAAPQHAYKLAAAMQSAQTRAGNPILLYLVRGAGHQIGVNRTQRRESEDFEMAFLHRELGLGTPR